VNILCFLPEKDVYNTIFAFPSLFKLKAEWRKHQVCHREISLSLHSALILFIYLF
jgi:hypothetical protein